MNLKLIKTAFVLIVMANIAGAVAEKPYQTFPDEESKPVAGYEHLPKSEIRNLGGSPALFVNGQPEVRLGIANTGDNSISIAEKLDCGMRIVKTGGLRMRGPANRDEFHAQLDSSVSKILNAIPDAKIILRLNIQPTNEFLEAHPESRVTGANGETVFQDRFNRYFKEVPRYRPSWASLQWRDYCDRELHDVVDYVSKQRYASHIIGALLSAGHTGEFDQWFGGEGWPGGNNGDWCLESQTRFRQWLKVKYDGDVQRLRKAWGKSDVTFETAMIDKSAVPGDPVSGFANPAANHSRADYENFSACQVPETIESWSRSLKLATGGRWVTGGMFAVSDSSGEDCKILNSSPWLDFGAGPGTYFYREPGNHTRHDFMGEEQRRSGKWFFDEMDFRTLLWSEKDYGVDTLEKSLSVLKREHAEVTMEGMGGYWFEFRGQVYHHPDIWNLFRKQSAISELAARHERTVPTDVAVIFGDGSGDMRTNVLSRIGTPYHAILFSTLMKQDPSTLPYRVYLFIGVSTVTTEQQEFIRANLMKKGNWLVFFRPAGVYCPDAAQPFDLANSTALHGISLVPKSGNRQDVTMTVASGSPLPDIAPGSALADPADDIPRKSRRTAWTVVNDGKVVTIATWKDGTVAAAVKRYPDWTAVYVSSQRVSAPFIRALIKASGAHQYLDNGDDVIFAAGPLLAFHTRSAGTREIKLREKADLYDLYTGKMVGEGKKTYSVPMAAKETYLFYLGDPRKELADINSALDAEILQRRQKAERNSQQRLEQSAAIPSSGPYPLFANGDLNTFLFLGPVPLPDVPPAQFISYEKSQLPLTHLADELQMRPAPFTQQKMVKGKTVFAWRPLVSGPAKYYAADYYEKPDRRLMFFVAVYLKSDSGGNYNLHLSTERGNQVYLDGRKIGEHFYKGDENLDLPLALEAGKRHLLLVKVFSAGGGNTGWEARLTGKDGKPATDVTSWLTEK